MPYSFFVDNNEITRQLDCDILEKTNRSSEEIIVITYQPQSIFRVRPSTRCSSTLSGTKIFLVYLPCFLGHLKEILSVSFSPDGKVLATGSGDASVRFWDLATETPQFTCQVHTNWVLCISWSPNGKYLASASMDKSIIIWDAKTGKSLGKPLTGHTNFISCLAWEPMHLYDAI